VRKELARYRGEETNTTDDGFLAIFDIADQVVKTTSANLFAGMFLFTPFHVLWLRLLSENFHHFLNRIPTASSGGHT
jgi:hypothetical protein